MKKNKLKYKVFCANPNGGESIKIAAFQSLDDAKKFAEEKAKDYGERYFSNNGTFVEHKGERIFEYKNNSNF